jgi:hypothetical protein
MWKRLANLRWLLRCLTIYYFKYHYRLFIGSLMTMAQPWPTYVWITAHLDLCNRSCFHFYGRFANISRAHVPGPARNRVKQCIVLRSTGLGLLSITNMYVRILFYALLWQPCLPVAGWAPDLARTQTRHVICSRMRTTLPGYPSCHQVQAGACRFADGRMDGYSI